VIKASLTKKIKIKIRLLVKIPPDKKIVLILIAVANSKEIITKRLLPHFHKAGNKTLNPSLRRKLSCRLIFFYKVYFINIAKEKKYIHNKFMKKTNKRIMGRNQLLKQTRLTVHYRKSHPFLTPLRVMEDISVWCPVTQGSSKRPLPR